MRHDDILIIGGGLCGLATATALARQLEALGQAPSIRVLERSEHLGGRAQTRREGGFAANLGPHALYRNQAAARVLKALGIDVPRRKVDVTGSYALVGDELHMLPSTPWALLKTDLIPWSAKLELVRFMTRLRGHRPGKLTGKSVGDWVAGFSPALQPLLMALVRLSTYSAPDALCADAAATALQAASFDGVEYIDGGWQTIADQLAEAAENAGVVVQTKTAVRSVARGPQGLIVRTADGETLSANDVILAGLSPRAVASVARGSAPLLAATLERLTPAEVAVHDVALNVKLEVPHRFVLGIDAPTYFSVHSETADVAPAGGSMVHVAIYRRPGTTEDPRRLRRMTEAHLDRLLPGWQDAVVFERFMPRQVAAHAMITSDIPLASRPSIGPHEVAGLWLAGDWVGDEGQLLDAALASADEVARAICAQRVSRRAA